MAEFDERWMRVVAAARKRIDPVGPPSEPHLRALAALARRRPESAVTSPRPFARVERRAIFALAALLVCGLIALVPLNAPIRELCAVASADLAVLPSRIPRPPHPPSAARALEALSDFRSFLDLSPSSTESQP